MVAYLILAHKDPQQVARLVRVLDAPCYIHIDARVDIKPFRDALLGLSVGWVKRHASPWGSFGIVAAALDGIAAALGTHEKISHLLHRRAGRAVFR